MGQTLTFLGLFWSAMRTADRIETDHGTRSRLWLTVALPVQLIGLLLVTRLAAALIDPARRLLRRPPNPWQERVTAAWLASLTAAGYVRSVPALVVLGGEGPAFSNAAARGVGLGRADSVWVIGRVGALPEDQLQAVLAHELGHLRRHHFIVLGFGIGLAAAVLPPFGRRLAGPALSPLGTLAAWLAGAALCAALSRHIEDAADDFAAAQGHGPGLAAFLDTAEGWKAERERAAASRGGFRNRLRLPPGSRPARLAELSERLFASHRSPADRRARLIDS